MFLLTAYLFKVCPDCTYPCNNSVVNIGMYVRIMTKMNVYLRRALSAQGPMQQPNISSNFTFNIINVFFLA